MTDIKGIKPIWPDDNHHRQWLESQIYTGPDGTGPYVPNLDDLVISYGVGFLRVVSVDETTGLSTTEPWVPPSVTTIDERDRLLGVGPGKQSESFRLLIDKSVTPYRIAADARLHKYGSTNTKVKFFLGTNVSETGTVISAMFDQSGQNIGENIPLELVAHSDVENYAVKAPVVGYSTYDLKDGESVTMVTYDDSGVARSFDELLVKNTAFVRPVEKSQLLIERIALESPFVSPDDQTRIDVPINVPLDALLTTARIYYSDGSTRVVNIDDNKTTLHGLDDFVATINDQEAPLVLTYELGPNEYSIDSMGAIRRHIPQTYKVRTVGVEGAYSVKLFVVPQWVDPVVGWKLDYFLYNLDRGERYYATPYIESAVNMAAFDGTLYAQRQWVGVAVDLEKVDSKLKPYRHVQTFGITLLDDGLADNTSWLLNYERGQSNEFGADLRAYCDYDNVGEWRIDISNGKSNFTEWLNALYYSTLPLYNPNKEAAPPVPTHFILSINGIRNEYDVSMWDDLLPSITGGSEGKSVIIEWRRRAGGTTLELGASPLKIVHEISGEYPDPNPDNPDPEDEITMQPHFSEYNSGTVALSGFTDVSTGFTMLPTEGKVELNWDRDVDGEGLPVEGTGTKVSFALGSGVSTADFEMKVTLVSRYQSGDGLNYLDIDVDFDEWLSMTDGAVVRFIENGWVPEGSDLVLEFTFRIAGDSVSETSNQFTVTKGPSE